MRAILKDRTQSQCASVPVAIYTRVSTTSQVGGRFDSCESQAAICREYVTKHLDQGWYEVACFTDAAYSGATMNRPGIQALKAQIERGLVKIVLIFKLERMLRSTDEWGPFRAFLQKHGCRLVSTTEDLSEETPSGRLKNNLLVSVAEYERLNTAEKVRAKMLAQAKRGLWNYGAVPYGYSYTCGTGKLEEHPEEGPVVRRIFEQAAELVPLGAIVAELDKRGLRTRVRTYRRPDGTTRTVGGRHFRTDGLRDMVANTMYAGKLRFRGEEYAGQHPALVFGETWERANAAANKVVRAKPLLLRPADKHFHLLKGIVFCAVCGRAMVPHAAGKRNREGRKYRYYTCGQLYREGEEGHCGVRHVSAAGLEKVVVAFIAEVHRHPEILQAAVDSSRRHKQDRRAPLQAKATEIERNLADISKRLRNCIDAIETGGGEVFELTQRTVALRDEKRNWLIQQEQVRQGLLECDQELLTADQIARSLERFGEIFPSFEPVEQKKLVRLCIERIDLRVSNLPMARPGARCFELQLRLPMARLIDGMEERVVMVRCEDGENGAPRKVILKLAAVLGKNGSATILVPFDRDVGTPWRAKLPPVPAVAQAGHPIRRALDWQRRWKTTKRTTLGAFAASLRVSRATLDFHLLLLRLAPEIQRFLRRLTRPDDIKYYGMIKMGAIARLPGPQQHGTFHELQQVRGDWGVPQARRRAAGQLLKSGPRSE